MVLRSQCFNCCETSGIICADRLDSQETAACQNQGRCYEA